jgi:hypothetical protein
VLLLHAASPDADDLHPLHGLLYDPAQENASHAGSWYIGRLLEPLGMGCIMSVRIRVSTSAMLDVSLRRVSRREMPGAPCTTVPSWG